MCAALRVREVSLGPIDIIRADVSQVQSKTGESSGPRRVKCTVSDGAIKCTALLATQVSQLVDNGELKALSIVQVDDMVGGKNFGKTAAASNKK